MADFAKALELRQKRAGLAEQARKILTKAEEEKRDLTGEEEQQFQKLHEDIDKMKRQIDLLEKQDALEAEMEQPINRQAASSAQEKRGSLSDAGGRTKEQEDVAKRNAALDAWARSGADRLTAEHRSIMDDLRQDAEQRAAQGSAVATGGYTIAPDTSWYSNIQLGMKAYDLPDSLFTVITTDTGANLPIPTVNDTAQSGALVAEHEDVVDATQITFANMSVDAYLFTSRQIPVSKVLLQDSSVDIAAFVGQMLGERMGRTAAAYKTTGTGSSQPNGLVTASTLGKTAAAVAAITRAELLDLKHSVDPTHRVNAKWMFHDTTLLLFKKLLDAENKPLWTAGMKEGEPDKIDGDPYVINQNMAVPATGAKTVLYGDFKKYLVRKVRGFEMMRLVERRAELGQVVFLGFERWDSDLLNAGTNPIKHLIQA